MHTVLIVTFALIGLVWGSFSNVLIARLPEGESIGGRSHCSKCGSTLGAQDLIPVISYVFLRGRCRYCSTSISPRYALVEILMAALFVAIYFRVGLIPWAVGLYIFYATVAVVIFFVDFEHAVIPNQLVLPGIIVALLATLLGWDPWGPSIGLSLWGGFIGTGVFLGLYLITGGAGMGMGDVKLAAYMGLSLGVWRLLPAVLLASLTALLWSGAVMVLFRQQLASLQSTTVDIYQTDEPPITERIWGMMIINGKPAVPFGSFLIVGFLLAFRWGDALMRWWLGLFT